MRDAETEAGLKTHGPDPYAPYHTPGLEVEPGSADPYRQDFSESSQQPLSSPMPPLSVGITMITTNANPSETMTLAVR